MYNSVKAVIEFYNIDEEDIFGNYYASNRFYHNMSHIYTLLNKANSRGILTENLFLAILFHDIIYDPRRTDNEEKSAELFEKYIQNDEVKQAILDTKTHIPTNATSFALCELDMEGLYGDLPTFIKDGNNIAKEYSYLDWAIYKEARTKFLIENKVNPDYIFATNMYQPKIGIYCGSFSPWHKGHMNILEKAEKIFDKVIIAQGINPDKLLYNDYKLPKCLENRQIEKYDGLLTNFISTLPYDVTIIRGLRNSTDLQYELTQYRFLQDLKPGIKVVSIFCDKEFEHISSSSIRLLEKYNEHHKYLIE